MDSKNVEMQFTLPVETVNRLNLLTSIINQFGSPCYGDNQYGSREPINLNDILNHILGNLADGVVPEENNKWEQSLLENFGLSPCCSNAEIKVALIEFDKTSNKVLSDS